MTTRELIEEGRRRAKNHGPVPEGRLPLPEIKDVGEGVCMGLMETGFEGDIPPVIVGRSVPVIWLPGGIVFDRDATGPYQFAYDPPWACGPALPYVPLNAMEIGSSVREWMFVPRELLSYWPEIREWERQVAADPSLAPIYADWCHEHGWLERAALLERSKA